MVSANKLAEYAMDPSFVRDIATTLGNNEPIPPVKAFLDYELVGTGTYGYNLRPDEVIDLVGDKYLPPSMLDTTVQYIGFSPELLNMPDNFAYSVIDHELTHAAEPKGKLALKSIYADTPFGFLPVGEMLMEGWTEYSLEKRGKKSPSRHFDEMHGYGNTAYSQYRQFVYDVEGQSPGITRQIVKAARKGGPNAAIRLIESIPDIDSIVTKYAGRLAQN